MTLEELRNRRWGALTRVADGPEQVVAQLAAVQAQDLAMALLAVALRCPGTHEIHLRQALDQGQILRTHAMRATWHLLAAKDLRWIVGLTGPRINQMASSYYRQWGLTESVRTRSRKLFEKVLRPGPQPRATLVAALANGGFTTNGQPVPLFLLDAEVHLLICSSPGLKNLSYDLVDRRVPATSPIPRDEAVARLCLRFLQGHGPATVKDMAWWSGLAKKDIRQALQDLGDRILCDCVADEEVWFDPKGPVRGAQGIHFWPAFDESLMGFADRTAFLETKYFNQVTTKNGTFLPFITVDGRVAGTWKTSVQGIEVVWLTGVPHGAEKACRKWELTWLQYQSSASSG